MENKVAVFVETVTICAPVVPLSHLNGYSSGRKNGGALMQRDQQGLEQVSATSLLIQLNE